MQSGTSTTRERAGTDSVLPRPPRKRDSSSVRAVANIAKACSACSRRKTRCSGGQPCTACSHSGVACSYVPSQRRGPKVKKGTLESTIDVSDPAQAASWLANLSAIVPSTSHHHPNGTTLPLPTPGTGSAGDSESNEAFLFGSNNQLFFEVIGAARGFTPTTTAGGSQPPPPTNPFASLLNEAGHTDRATTSPPPPPPPPAALLGSLSTSFPGPSAMVSQSAAAAPAQDGEERLQSKVRSSHPPALERSSFQKVTVYDFSSLLPCGTGPSESDAPSSVSPRYTTTSETSASPDANASILSQTCDRDLQVLAEQPTTIALHYRLYWTFSHGFWPVVYRPTFDPLLAAAQTPALHYAILAIMSRGDITRQLKDTPNDIKLFVRASQLGEYYYARSKVALDMTDMASTVLNIQSMILLCCRDIAQGRIRQAWMFSGMAIRMAFDLQLHQPSRQGTNSGARNSIVAQQEQNRAVWACYVLDKCVSLMLGRPVMLRRADISDEFNFWIEDARPIIPGRAHLFTGLRSNSISTFNAWARLMTIVERVMESVYAPQRRASTQVVAVVYELNAALNAWADESKDVLAMAVQPAPTHILLCNLWFHTTRLILHRPLIPTSHQFETLTVLKSSYTLCTEAADAIFVGVTLVEETFGIFRCPHSIVFIIFQAGIMYLANSSVKDADVAAVGRARLQKCISWLEAIAGWYSCSPPYAVVLQSLAELSKGELRDEVQVYKIMASRVVSRAASPNLDGAEPNLNDIFPSLAVDNPLSNLHYSFWDTMPLGLPITNEELGGWENFQVDYSSLLVENDQ